MLTLTRPLTLTLMLTVTGGENCNFHIKQKNRTKLHVKLLPPGECECKA